MNPQSEQHLEDALIVQLETLGWDRVRITDAADLVAHLKAQLEFHSGVSPSGTEFCQNLQAWLA